MLDSVRDDGALLVAWDSGRHRGLLQQRRDHLEQDGVAVLEADADDAEGVLGGVERPLGPPRPTWLSQTSTLGRRLPAEQTGPGSWAAEDCEESIFRCLIRF
jgi:hypothetical protein